MVFDVLWDMLRTMYTFLYIMSLRTYTYYTKGPCVSKKRDISCTDEDVDEDVPDFD